MNRVQSLGYLLPTYTFAGVDTINVTLPPGEELEIKLGDKQYILQGLEGDPWAELHMVSPEKKLITSRESGTIILEQLVGDNKELLWIFPSQESVALGGGSSKECGIQISGLHILDDVKKDKKTGVNIRRDSDRGHMVGHLYDPNQGHIFNGGIFYSTNAEKRVEGPFLIFDFQNDVELKAMYEKVIREMGTSEESTLKRVFDEMQVNYLSDKFKDKLKKLKQGIRIGPLLKRLGGICCYQAFGVCAIIEQLIVSKHLPGRIFYAGGKDHGWPLYQAKKDDQLYVLDTTQSNFVNVNENPGTTFKGVERKSKEETIYGRFRYIDFLPTELVAEVRV